MSNVLDKLKENIVTFYNKQDSSGEPADYDEAFSELSYSWYESFKEGDSLDFEDDSSLVFVANETKDISDSYDWTDNAISLIFAYEGHYFEISGTEQSYSGTELKDFKEVEAKTKTVTYYE